MRARTRVTKRWASRACALALGLCGGLAASLGLGAPAAAQDFPTRVVKLIVPFPPAGATDIAARLIAEHLSKTWPHAVVVENRSGASGLIGTEAAARAPADGHTLLMGTLATNVMAHLLQANVPYGRDAFEPAILLTSAANILMANSKVPASNLQELVAFAKANPGKVKYGSSGVGLSGHLGVELFAAAAGVKLVHVPYRGSAPSGQAFAGGEVELTLGLIPQAMSAMKSAPGIKPIAIGAKERAPQFPDTPTFAELGYPNVLVYAINGLMVPKGTPRAIIDKIHRDALAGLKDPAVKERMEQLGLDVIGASPKEFGDLLADEFARWEPLIRANDIKAE